jgi:O-antigen/teichoic acid export membrane protein
MSADTAGAPAAADVRGSVRTYVSSIAGTYLFLALSLATSIYLTRSLGAGGFGSVTLALTVVQTATIFGAFWSHAGFLRYGAEALARQGRLHQVFWGRAAAVAPAVLVVAVAGWILRDWIAAFHGVVEIGFLALAAYFVVLLAGQTLQVVFQARGRAGVWSFLQAGERALILGVLLLLPARPGIVLLVYVAAGLALVLGGLALADRRDFAPVETSRESVRRFMDFSWPILIGVFGSYFTSNWLDVAIIRRFLDAAAVGQYALAYQLMGAVQQIPMLSFPIVVPLLVGAHVGQRDGSLRIYLDRVVPHALFLMVALLFAGVLLVPPLVPLLFGTAFGETARALPVLLLAVGFYSIFIAYIPILNVRERTGGMLAASAAAAAANLAGDLALIPVRGIVGAAWATVASQCASAAVVAWIAWREQRFDVRPLALFLAPLVLAVVGWTFADGWLAAVSVFLAAALLVAAGRMHRLCSASDRQLLASLGLPAPFRWLPVAIGGRP